MELEKLIDSFMEMVKDYNIKNISNYYQRGCLILSKINSIMDYDQKMGYLIQFINIIEDHSHTLKDKNDVRNMLLAKTIQELYAILNEILIKMNCSIYSNALIIMSPRYANKEGLIHDICTTYDDYDKLMIVKTSLKLTRYINKTNLQTLSKILLSIKDIKIKRLALINEQ